MTVIHILTKKEAWNTGVDEKWLPTDKKQHPKGFRFRRRWFHQRNCCTFSTFLPDKFPADKPHKILTIGVFEAAQEVWLLQNILSHPSSRIVGIDPWLAENKISQSFANQCWLNAQHNLHPWKEKATLLIGSSQRVLPKIQRGEYDTVDQHDYDLIIIDGDHRKEPTYTDAVNALMMIRIGGWILFDDVRQQRSWQKRSGDHVVHAVQQFIDTFSGGDLAPDRIKQAWSHRFCETYERVY